jgi:hypothetical protein
MELLCVRFIYFFQVTSFHIIFLPVGCQIQCYRAKSFSSTGLFLQRPHDDTAVGICNTVCRLLAQIFKTLLCTGHHDRSFISGKLAQCLNIYRMCMWFITEYYLCKPEYQLVADWVQSAGIYRGELTFLNYGPGLPYVVSNYCVCSILRNSDVLQ